MATADITENVTCSICLNVFDKPKALPCLHTYCETCIESHIDKTQKNGCFRCPLCSESVHVPAKGVAGLKDNFHMYSLISQTKIQPADKDPICALCEIDDIRTPAVKMCIECSDHLCNPCSTGHTNTRMTKGHQVVSLDDVKHGRYAKEIRSHKKAYCTVHHKEPLKIYCEDCSLPICMLCKVFTHDKHSALSPEDAFRRTNEDVESRLAGLGEMSEFAELCITEINDATVFNDDEEKRMTTEITKYFENHRKLVSDKENELLNKVRENAATIRAKLGKSLETAQAQKQALTNTINTARNYLENEDGFEKLDRHPKVVERMMKSKRQDVHGIITRPVYSLEFPEIPEIGNLNTKAETVLKAKKGLSKTAKCKLKFQAVRHVCDLIYGGNRPESTQCTSIIRCNEKYFIVDQLNHTVKIHSNKGQFQKTMNNFATGQYTITNPVDIASNDGNDILIADDNIHGVVIYDVNCVQKNVIRDVYEGSGKLTCDPNRIITTGGGKLTIMDKDGAVQNIVDKDSLGLDEFQPHYVSTTPAGDIVTTDAVSKCVYILDDIGKRVLYTYQPEGELALENPQGVTCDQWGHILVVDGPGNKGGRVHAITTTGEHLAVVLQQNCGMRSLRGISVCEAEFSIVDLAGNARRYGYLNE